ncbi:MAG TPA: hypothetical protein VGJ98_07675 [Candidatus Eisenbacteria bacterium]
MRSSVSPLASRPRWALLLVACAAAGILGGCSSGTQLVDMWKDPTAPSTPIRKMLVVAIRKDPLSRRIWEDGFVTALEKRGVTATPSYNMFPNAAPDTVQIERAVREHEFDGVLLTHRLGATTQTTYVPGYTRLEPVWVRSRWSNAYHTYWREVYEPGYTETDQVVRHRVDVWSTAGGWRLVWSGTTESINPNSSRDVNVQITKLIIPELLTQGVIAR